MIQHIKANVVVVKKQKNPNGVAHVAVVDVITRLMSLKGQWNVISSVA